MLFLLIGAILFLASGSLITDVYQNSLNSKDVGLATSLEFKEFW